MASALPLRPAVDHTRRPRSVLDLTEEHSSTVLEALASETARAVLSTLAEAPATASDVAGRVDTSVQNAHYHLTNLQEAGVVTRAGTWYSSKGREMTVYDVTSEEIQIRLGDAGAEPGSQPTDTDDSATRPPHVST